MSAETETTLEIHEIAKILPDMTESEYQALKEGIRTNGQRVPIWTLQGKILDGRRRFLACQESRALAEQRFLPYSDIIHARTEAWGPDSAFGHALTYLLVVLPLGWVLVKAVFSKRPVFQPASRAARASAGDPLPLSR